jgi:hypothetical protein
MNKIIFPLKLQMRGPAVADLQDALQLCLERSAILANDGGPRVELMAALRRERLEQIYGDATGKLVSIFERERNLRPSGEVDEPAANALNGLLQEWGMLDHLPEPAAAGYQVDGRVVSRASAGVGGLRVALVDKGVGGDVQLAQAITDDRGGYQASFSDSDVRRRGKMQPDLQARVFTGDAFLGASNVHYNASQHETLNVSLEDKATSALQSEHEVLTSAVASQFRGRLGDLKETDQQQDITYLANKTGWDARAVALAALADQFSARTTDAAGAPAIPQAFFYALFRAGLPANENTLYHTDAKTLEGVWRKAAEQGVISKAPVDQIPNLIGRFQALSAQKLLTGPALVGASSLKEMLTISGLNEQQQSKFAELYAANRTDMPAFWKGVGDAFDRDTASRLQVDGKLSFLTINNASLMQKVRTTAGASGLSDTLQLAQTGYYRADAWSQLLSADVPIPKEIPGDTQDIKRSNYAGCGCGTDGQERRGAAHRRGEWRLRPGACLPDRASGQIRNRRAAGGAIRCPEQLAGRQRHSSTSETIAAGLPDHAERSSADWSNEARDWRCLSRGTLRQRHVRPELRSGFGGSGPCGADLRQIGADP